MSLIGSLTGRADAALLPVSDLLSRLDALEETVNASTSNQQLSLLQGDPPLTGSLAHSPTWSVTHPLSLSLISGQLTEMSSRLNASQRHLEELQGSTAGQSHDVVMLAMIRDVVEAVAE